MPPSASSLIPEGATMAQAKRRTTAEKLGLFRSFFAGLTHVYGTYDPQTGRVRQAKEPVTDQVLLAHLRGEQPYGVYLLVQDRTRAVVVDFDDDDLLRAMAFMTAAEARGISAHVERSKSKGYHVWIFFAEAGVFCAAARAMARSLLQEIGQPQTEVFPKQDRLDSETAYGNFINAPLFGRLVPKGRSVFLDPADQMRPYADQWEFLATVRRLTAEELESALSKEAPATAAAAACLPADNHAADDSGRTFGLPPCAKSMLKNGVDGYQRVACFRLAVHLKLAGIPEDLAAVLLKAWSAKNHPPGKQIITPAEINDQVRDAYAKCYRGCGCEDPQIKMFCGAFCPLHQHREASEKPGAAPAVRAPARNSENSPPSTLEAHPAVLSAALDRQAECGSDRVDHRSGGQAQPLEAKERA
jgi:hypothetical protein